VSYMRKFLLQSIARIGYFLRIRKIFDSVSLFEHELKCRSLTGNSLAIFGPSANICVPPRRTHANIVVGKHSLVDGELLIHDYGGKIEIGESTYIGKGSRIWSGENVRIGNHVFVAHNCTITDTNSHQYSARERAEDYQRRIIEHKPFEKGSIKTAPIVIEDHVWINFGVGILKGVRIGEGAIIGSGSLVTKDVAPWTLVAGSPAKFIRDIPER